MALPSVRTGLAIAAGRSAARLSRAVGLGGGGVVGGRVALAVRPDLLERLASGRTVVLVTGTNGKTTTAHLLAAALRTVGPVAHNASGANMLDGALAALLAAPSAPTAVLEIDELHLPDAVTRLRPAVVVLLNLTRDQLDRGAEVASVARVVRSALTGTAAVVVANSDDPVVTALAAELPDVVWVAGGSTWAEDAASWGAPTTPSPPAPDWWLDGADAVGPRGRTRLEVGLPGRFNDGNALLALAAATALGVPADRAATAMSALQSVAGRYASVRHHGRPVTLMLAKNPAGWRETLPLLTEGSPLVLAVNAREPDGRDTSWLWDVPFEELPTTAVVACGEAAADLGLRLSYAGVAHDTVPDPLLALDLAPPGDAVLVANYTAFTGVLRRLQHGR